MTTANLNAEAAATLASLRDSLNNGLAACAAELAAAKALPASDMPYVIYARCGMVVVPAGDTGYRLAGTHDGLKAAAKFTANHGRRVATAWNRGLTPAQWDAKCDVRNMSLTMALEVAMSELRQLLDTLEANLPAHAAAARDA